MILACLSAAVGHLELPSEEDTRSKRKPACGLGSQNRARQETPPLAYCNEIWWRPIFRVVPPNLTTSAPAVMLASNVKLRISGLSTLELAKTALYMSLVKIQRKGQLTLPSRVRNRLGLSEGDLVDVKVRTANIVITPQGIIDRSKFPSADEEYTPEQRQIIDARLAEADEDVIEGRLYGPFETHEEFIASLHKEAKKLRTKKSKRAAQ